VVFFGHFLFTYSFHLKLVSESVGDPFRLSGFKNPLRSFALFSEFLDLQTPPHCTLYIAYKNLQFLHPGCLLQCGISAPYPCFWLAETINFRTVICYQPAAVASVKFFELDLSLCCCPVFSLTNWTGFLMLTYDFFLNF
jgi:hypothetical protein